jgi:hypothetical protein
MNTEISEVNKENFALRQAVTQFENQMKYLNGDDRQRL